jgi:hypothetical protein
MPNFDAQQQAIERKRQMAMQLANQAMLPLQAPPVPGAKTSAWEGVAKLVQALSGRIGANQADKQQDALATAMQEAAQQQATGLAEAAVPPAQGTTATMESPVIPGYTTEYQIPPNLLQEDARKATVKSLSDAMASQNPMMREAGMAQYKSLLDSSKAEDVRKAEMARVLVQQKFQRNQQLDEQYGADQRQGRQQEFTGAQNDLTRQAAAEKPVEVGGALVDPQTGKAIYTAPPNPFDIWLKQNPGAPIGDWIKLNQKDAAADKVGNRSVQTIDDKGNPITKIVPDVPSSFPSAPTSDMRNKEAVKGNAMAFIGELKKLADGIIKNPQRYQQIVDSIKRGGEAAVMSDPEYRTYQDFRSSDGVDPAVWGVMTPEEKALWGK